jgi:uncharacterized protein (DUF2062 family)/SAM-dependent methyltransferase
MHGQLRTEGGTPARHAAAIAIGTFIGCIPLYGAHLLLCVSLARLFRLNRALTYLAAHINNPLTAPGLLALSFGVGHRLLEGSWPPMTVAEIIAVGAWKLGRDLFFGSAVLGLVFGAVLGTVAYVVSLRARPHPDWALVVEETGRRYMPAGIVHWEFVRGKLLHDPLYREIWSRLGTQIRGRILDLGCGRGIVLALADTARRTGLPPGPARLEGVPMELIGVEVRAAAAGAARAALGDAARIEIADLSDYTPPAADVVLLFDVLHYLDAPAQERILSRVARALGPGGVLLVREPDASSGISFRISRAAERLRAVARGTWRQRFHYRSASEWTRLLGEQGLAVTQQPLNRDTPFSNVLFEARPTARLDAASVTRASSGR